MEAERNVSKFNGVQTQSGNFLWGGAMCLAWAELRENIIKQPIELDTQDEQTIKTAANFNNAKFSIKDLDEECYFVKSGFGNKTIREINEGTKAKFPKKTTSKNSNEQLKFAQSIYLNIFNHSLQIKLCQTVASFLTLISLNPQTFANLLNSVSVYQILILPGQGYPTKEADSNEFMIQIKSKNQNDLLFFIKHPNQNMIIDEVLQIHEKRFNQTAPPMEKSDSFMMPYVKLEEEHHFGELINKSLKNKNFAGYSFSEVYEIIKLEIDEAGVKVQNQAVMMLRGCARPLTEPKRLHLDKQFWIIMQEKGKHPYFAGRIRNPTK